MENCNDWVEYKPPQNGTEPSDYDYSRPVEYQALGKWVETPFPGWFACDTYRYKRRKLSGIKPHTAVVDDLTPSLPDDASKRLEYPMAEGLIDYFPNALAEVARLSHCATQQHHPDEDMHWDRGKSTDHANKIVRHLVDRGLRDDKGQRHSTMVAWRALAMLQEEIERDEGLPPSRASRNRPF